MYGFFKTGNNCKNQGLRELILNRKLNGLNLKVITEITAENISYCKEIMLIVDELRHLDGIKSTFYSSDTEYIALAYLHGKGQPVEQIIYSNVKEIVEHQRYLFQTLWT
jgi:two-component system, OmpR family, sensor histidine kinase VicK